MTQYVYVHVNHAYIYNWSAPSCYLCTAVLSDCYIEVTAYTAPAYSIFHDAYVTWYFKADQVVTNSISSNNDFKYWSHHGFLVLDCSHVRLTV